LGVDTELGIEPVVLNLVGAAKRSNPHRTVLRLAADFLCKGFIRKDTKE